MATRPGDGVLKLLLPRLPFGHAELEPHIESGVPAVWVAGGRV